MESCGIYVQHTDCSSSLIHLRRRQVKNAHSLPQYAKPRILQLIIQSQSLFLLFTVISSDTTILQKRLSRLFLFFTGKMILLYAIERTLQGSLSFISSQLRAYMT